jgi:hypothetical protein
MSPTDPHLQIAFNHGDAGIMSREEAVAVAERRLAQLRAEDPYQWPDLAPPTLEPRPDVTRWEKRVPGSDVAYTRFSFPAGPGAPPVSVDATFLTELLTAAGWTRTDT